MNNLRNCLYQGKNFFRDRSYLFWTVLYPIVLATFFYFGFSGIMDSKVENINVGIEADNQFSYILESIDFLNIHEISEEDMKEKLYKGEIDAFIDKDLNLTVSKSGINQTIVKEVVEYMKQSIKLNRPIDSSEFSTNYVSGQNQMANSMMVIFYSLIAMTSAYGVFAGIHSVIIIQSNLSYIGARLNVTPLKKLNFIINSIIVSIILNLFSNILLILFINFILKIKLFSNIGYSAIFVLLGNLFGVILGIFIGVSNKKSANVKVAIAIATTLFLSHLSGMMGVWTKILIDKNAPIINKLNPISVITNNLYRINILESTKSVEVGIVVLLLYSGILLLLSYMFLRRKSYDSI